MTEERRVVARRSEALAVLRDPEHYTVEDPRFATARVVGPSMLSLEGAEHARHRAPFVDAFRLDAVRALAPAVQREADALIDDFAASGEAELRTRFAGPLAARVMAMILGTEATPAADVLRWYGAIVAATTAASEGREPDPSGAAAFAALAAAIGPALGEAGDLDPDEVASNAAVLLFGGIETTEGMICNAVWHLLTNPRALARVREDPALLPAAVEESLRLEPAAAVVDRYVTDGGGKVVVSLREANRDPDTFPDPDAFDLDRRNARRHLAFAAGPHVCLGMHLARLEAQTALHRLLARLPELVLAEPTEPAGAVFRKPAALRVRWTPPRDPRSPGPAPPRRGSGPTRPGTSGTPGGGAG